MFVASILFNLQTSQSFSTMERRQFVFQRLGCPRHSEFDFHPTSYGLACRVTENIPMENHPSSSIKLISTPVPTKNSGRRPQSRGFGQFQNLFKKYNIYNSQPEKRKHQRTYRFFGPSSHKAVLDRTHASC